MRKDFRSMIGSLVMGLCVLAAGVLHAQAVKVTLPKDSKLAIVGDSITEQKQYSKFMEIYLLACAGRKDVTVFQFGWGGETANGFSGRAENDLSVFKPTVVTLCYGMNDGGYRLFNDGIGGNYEKAMRTVIEKLKAMGVSQIVAGSPGAVDTTYFQRNKGAAEWAGKTPAEGYNDNLKHLRDIDEKLAGEYKIGFADVHTPMVEAMAKAKKAKGEDYDVCGRDGVHPGANGHLIMASAFLKSLGCDGNIGEITIDMKGNATASEGHKVLSSSSGKVELESVKYPFCAYTDQNLAGIMPFIPFNQELNRLTLKVKNLGAAKAKVTWGGETKEFAREQLEAGVNLAAEFQKTPFDADFSKLSQAVAAKQAFETTMIKGIITQFRMLSDYMKDDAELKSACETLKRKLADIGSKKDAEVKSAIVPVKHAIAVTP